MYDASLNNNFTENTQQVNAPQRDNITQQPWQNNNRNNNYYNKGKFQDNNRFRKPEEEYNGIPVVYKTYTGTGNKDAPPNIIARIKSIAIELENEGFVCRTSVVGDSELAFSSVTKKQELMLPWKEFKDDSGFAHNSKFMFSQPEIMDLAKKFHPGFETLHYSIQKILGRNIRMMVGNKARSPSSFLICWSEDGAESIADKTPETKIMDNFLTIAKAYNIPVFNFGNQDAEIRLKNFLGINNVEKII